MKGMITVFKKEARELLRDKRTRTSALFGPLFLVVMMLFLFGSIEQSVSKPSSQKIHVVAGHDANAIVQGMRKAGITILTVPSIEEGRTAIQNGSARLVLDFPVDFDSKLASGQEAKIEEYFDPTQEGAEITKSFVERIVGELNSTTLKALLASQKIPESKAQPFKIDEKPVQVGKASAGQALIGLLPYLIVIWAFYGGMGAVGDLVAGEKEKNTLETLLIVPVSRTQIALGKLLALGLLCTVSALSSLLGVLVMGILNLPQTRSLFSKGLGVSPVGFLVTLAVLLPTVLLFASALLAASTRARNMREAYTQLTLLSFVVLMPAVFSQFIGFTDFAHAKWVPAAPILNTATTIRQALLGAYDPYTILVTMGVNLALGALVLRYTISLFNREQVLVRL